ncbi:MAG: efflux RND transporter periplasmic adaptor subunit, partial [Planctomycetaceae bacterium]
MRRMLLGIVLGISGCARAPQSAQTAAPPTIMVSHPLEQEVKEFADYTGRTAAVESVEIRARVSGYLQTVNFKEGALVQKGDVLYEIDPREYQDLVDANAAQLEQSEASLKLATANNERYKTLAKEKPGVVTQQDLDKYQAEASQATANVSLAKANLASAQLKLEWTKVVAPVSGRVSRTLVTVGNLVQAGDQGTGTLLTNLVSIDPMYAYFDVDEHTALRVRQLIREGKSASVREGEFPVSMGLANEAGHPHQGTIDFVDNQVNPKTGTIRLRGVFRNQEEVLLPGFFVRVRTPVGLPHKSLLVTERALDTEQGQKIVYVVNDQHEVVARPVKLGVLHDGLREITDGLEPGD